MALPKELWQRSCLPQTAAQARALIVFHLPTFLTLVHREVASISSMPKKAESEIADFLQKLAPNLEARYAASFARVVELLSS